MVYRWCIDGMYTVCRIIRQVLFLEIIFSKSWADLEKLIQKPSCTQSKSIYRENVRFDFHKPKKKTLDYQCAELQDTFQRL